MIAKLAIDDNIPYLKPTDTVSFALELMEEYKVYHLPIVENKNIKGIISEEQLIEQTTDILLSDLDFPLLQVVAQENLHLFDLMRLGYESTSSVMPIVDKEQQYLGLVSPKSLLEQLHQFNFSKEKGGIFVLEIKSIQYSLVEIARIVESNHSVILSVATTHLPHSIDDLLVTIKVNTLDLTYILASFERYNYNIVQVFHKAEQIDQLKERWEAFMHYISI